MKLLVFVLNKIEKLDNLLHELKLRNVSGATIIEGTGMVRELIENDDMGFLLSLKSLFDNPRKPSKVMMMVVKNEEEVKTVIETVDKVVGDLSEPNSGILFTIPVDFVKGMKN